MADQAHSWRGRRRRVGYGAPPTADSLEVGPIRLTSVPVQVSKAPMGASLLGMTFPRRLDSVELRDDRLYRRARD
jgi:predicted aspartyl protease